jgi:hypothetical protein
LIWLAGEVTTIRKYSYGPWYSRQNLSQFEGPKMIEIVKSSQLANLPTLLHKWFVYQSFLSPWKLKGKADETFSPQMPESQHMGAKTGKNKGRIALLRACI